MKKINYSTLEQLKKLRDDAMKKAVSEPIPYCGPWGEIAQELDNIIGQIAEANEESQTSII